MRILITSAIIITLIITWFYFYLRVNTKEVSNESPFKEVIDTKLTLDRDIFLIRKNTSDFHKEISTVVDNKGDIGRIDENMIVEVIPKGTALTIHKATIQSHGESGTYGLITGILHTKQYDIPFKQNWGRLSVYIMDKSDPVDNTIYFTFEQAIWESESDYNRLKTYYLPEL